jgi:hypothetical protein
MCDELLYACIIQSGHQGTESVFKHFLYFFITIYACATQKKKMLHVCEQVKISSESQQVVHVS